jgi:hypothetical protein
MKGVIIFPLACEERNVIITDLSLVRVQSSCSALHKVLCRYKGTSIAVNTNNTCSALMKCVIITRIYWLV